MRAARVHMLKIHSARPSVLAHPLRQTLAMASSRASHTCLTLALCAVCVFPP